MDQITGSTTKFGKRILLVWVFAIMWIYVGNIINFHQHHIWGKQLIPVAFTSNRSKGKSIIQYQDNSTQLSFGSHDIAFISGPALSIEHPVPGCLARISDHPPFISVPPSLACMGLRAPPTA